jgi:D-glycero-D-manno-heptose 1,7-bisphosphate phosphatase
VPELATVFLDRDGTINRKAPEGDYVKSVEEFELLPGAAEAVRALADAGMLVVVVTNQRGIARGRMTEADLAAIHERLRREVSGIDAIYHCPHEEGACDCRKPRTGMFLQAQRDFPQIDFSRSAVIGDSPSDMQAGRALGSRLVMIGDGRGEEVDLAVDSLAEAAGALLAGTRASH